MSTFTEIFSEQKLDLEKQFKTFAYGIVSILPFQAPPYLLTCLL
jgi:hypothetical protein